MYDTLKLSDYIYDCQACPTRCDGISKGNYQFNNDVSFSEYYEEQLINIINNSNKYTASKCTQKGYPDIELRDEHAQVCKYVEVKVQQRTFMNVQKILPNSALQPSETVALNLSDLLRYFTIQSETKTPVTILWVLLNRPCITTKGKVNLYHQSIDELEKIYDREKNNRRFRRQSGEGDIVDGEHKGVTVNYHFSLRELLVWS
jgi:hypothetical protein